MYPSHRVVGSKSSGNEIRIDLGSFNNCPSARNFLERTAGASMMKFDLLDHRPEPCNFAYEKDIQTRSVSGPCIAPEELGRFRKGRHYLDG